MQYKTGSVAVTNGSNVATGTGTAWLTELSVGGIFTVQGSGVWYQIASIVSDVSLTLTANYGGATASGLAYAVTRDFTPNYNFPYPVKNDVDTASIVARALVSIDAKIASLVALNALTPPE